MCILSDFFCVLLKPRSWIWYFAVQRAWGFEYWRTWETGMPRVRVGTEEFPEPSALTGLAAWSQKCKPPLGSHLSSAWAAPLIAFQSQFPPPLFLPCTLGLGLGSGLGCNCVPELRGSTPFWGILELLMPRPKSREDGHSWRRFGSELEFKLQRVYFDVLTLGCEFCIRNWIPRVKGRQENLGNGCNFQLWYLSGALSSIRNYSGEFLLWEWVSCLASFLGLS